MKQLKIAGEFTNHAQAELAANQLMSADIPCWVRADDCGGAAPGQSFVRGVKVFVYEEDYLKAYEVLHGE